MDNELIVHGERLEFNQELFNRRGVIKAKYWSWESPRLGLVMFAGKDFLRVLFQTGVTTATSYFTIKIDEVKKGLWEIIYTPDLEHYYKIEGGQTEEDIDLIAEVHKLFEED